MRTPDKIVIGYVEMIGLSVSNNRALAIKAKIDTGATISCLHALDIVADERTAAGRVPWKLDGQEREWQFSLPVAGWVNIKSNCGPSERRPTVILPVELAGRVVCTPFSLANRTNRYYPALLGMSFLRDLNCLVDPRRKYRHTNLSCYPM